MDQTFDVICLGDATIDIFLPLNPDDKNLSINSGDQFFFKSGEKYLANGYKLFPGGIASNVAVGLSKLNKKVGVIAEIGTDSLSDKIIRNFEEDGVSTKFVKRNPDRTPTLATVVSRKGQHILFLAHVLSEHQFTFDNLKTSWLFLAGLGDKWKNAYKNALNYALANNIKIAFAPGINQIQEGKESLSDIIQSCSVIFLNKYEAKMLAGETDDVKSLLEQIKKMGSKVVVITDGLNGSYCIDADSNAYHLDALKVDTVETTGAGDAYTSGFFAAYVSNESIENAMKWGALNSASVVQKVGAQEGLLDNNSLQNKLSSTSLNIEKL